AQRRQEDRVSHADRRSGEAEMSWLLSGYAPQRHGVRRVKFRNSNFGIRIFPTPRPQRLRGELSETFRIGELENGKEQINEKVFTAHSAGCVPGLCIARGLLARFFVETGIRQKC